MNVETVYLFREIEYEIYMKTPEIIEKYVRKLSQLQNKTK